MDKITLTDAQRAELAKLAEQVHDVLVRGVMRIGGSTVGVREVVDMLGEAEKNQDWLRFSTIAWELIRTLIMRSTKR